MIWNANSIQIFVDNILVVQMNNKTSEEEFRNPHYLLLNIAMGGSLGGSVPDDFKEDSMEIDFVRVYQ
jgi:beta-glucanase (GH16 family)